MSKVLVISPDEIKKEMAGPAIRAFEIAKYLEKNHKVSIVYNPLNLTQLISENDVIICQHLALTQYPVLRKCKKSLVFDLYNLSIFECLEIALKEPAAYQALFGEYHPLLNVYTEILKTGDFFICANERQGDFWLGMLASLGRIDIKRYKGDDNLKNLIDIVPFGISNEPPTHTRVVLKGAHPQIQPQDKVILWAGGVYDWLDPLTSVKAMHRVAAIRPEIKLFFMGIRNPYRPLPKMRLSEQAIKLAQDLGLYDKNIFFNDWVAYEDRQNYLLEADIGITTHHRNMEAYYSCRTRVLDYIWANLPIIISEGDGFSEIVKRHNLGLAVKDNDPDGVAQAILKLLDDNVFYRNCKNNLKSIAPDFYWGKAIEPLDYFCHSPQIPRNRANNILINNGLSFYISQMPFYISYFGYKGLLIKIFKQILRNIKRAINSCAVLPKGVFLLAFSFSVLCLTFAAILLNDLFVMPFFKAGRND